tara:strand:- start:1078 stop:3129 length:2052 start_codon:yes stop_codon:yes gene_type:complete
VVQRDDNSNDKGIWEPMLDALLDESLGSATPPDVTDDVVRRIQSDSVTTTGRQSYTARKQRSPLVPWLIAAVVLIGIGTSLIVALNNVPDNNNVEVAENQPDGAQNPDDKPNDGMIAETQIQSNANDSQDDIKLIGPNQGALENNVAINDMEPFEIPITETIALKENSIIIASINAQIESAWQDLDLEPSKYCQDEEWCRRTYLRLIGRVPTVDELESFLSYDDSARYESLVDLLLNDDRYTEEFSRHWSTVWTNALVGRRGGSEESLTNRAGLLKFMRDSFARGISFDQVAFELISATGNDDPTSDQYNGAANYILCLIGDDTTLITSRTSEVFLGQKLQCAQCHSHPGSKVAQNQFWEMDAFFAQTTTAQLNDGSTSLANVDYVGKSKSLENAESYFEQPTGEIRVAYPAFLGQKANINSGELAEFDRREWLAKLVRYSPLLAKSVVNRLWSHFFGFGFTQPIDDLGPHNPVSHPELFELLARQTMASEYDLRLTMKWIVLSDAFRRSSTFSPTNDFDSPEQGSSPLFSRYYTRQLQPEEVYQSLQVLAGIQRDPNAFRTQELAQRAWLGRFVQNMDTDEGNESNLFDGDIRQSLAMMNGELMQKVTDLDNNTTLGKIIRSEMENQAKLEHLFLAALSRKPTQQESTVVLDLVSDPSVDAVQVFQDIWWALLNSNEFILDH